MSGYKYRPVDLQAARDALAAEARAEEARLQGLRSNASMPLVFFDVSIRGACLQQSVTSVACSVTLGPGGLVCELMGRRERVMGAGRQIGRIVMALFMDISPRSAENFRQLCEAPLPALLACSAAAGGQRRCRGAASLEPCHAAN